LTPLSGLGLGVATLWLSLLVLIPLAAVLVTAGSGGWAAFAATLASPQTRAAIGLTIMEALAVAAVDAVVGTVIAWVLVRDRFRGRRILDVVIDVPFALPTVVTGLVLLTLYGAASPIHLNWANTRMAVFLALLFVTLPFVVRSVQPVLMELDPEVELAAASLGASDVTILRRIVLPALAPAIASGAALSFARGISEYGSLVLFSGNLPYHTEVASVRILSYIEGDKTGSAAAVAAVLLAVAAAVIMVCDLIARQVVRRG